MRWTRDMHLFVADTVHYAVFVCLNLSKAYPPANIERTRVVSPNAHVSLEYE